MGNDGTEKRVFNKARKLLLKSLKILPRSSTYNALANLENRAGIEKPPGNITRNPSRSNPEKVVLVRGTHSLRCLKFHVETLTKQRSYLNEDGLVSNRRNLRCPRLNRYIY